MPMMDADPIAMMQRLVWPWQRAIVLDVGANLGQTSARFREVFPDAHIFAFEPGPAALVQLRARAQELGNIQVVEAAVSDREGMAELNVTEFHQLSSLLSPSAAGKAYHGPGMQTQRVVRVPTITIDQWFAREQLPRVDLMKIDVQGAELAALKGARNLLRSGSVLAVNSEAQVIPEYQGASTFFEINAELEDAGFVFHQFHEVWEHGVERQHSCIDALWIRREALSWLREFPNSAYIGDWRRRFRAGLAMCLSEGKRKIAVHGSGEHTRAVLSDPKLDRSKLVCVINDVKDPTAGTTTTGTVEGLPVVSCLEAVNSGVDGIILSDVRSDEALWWSTQDLRERGLCVQALYGPYLGQAPAAKSRFLNRVARDDFVNPSVIGVQTNRPSVERSGIAGIAQKPDPQHFSDLVCQEKARAALKHCVLADLDPIALYGAGALVRRISGLLAEPSLSIRCVIDDDVRRQGANLWGYPIVSREQAIASGIKAVLLASDAHERLLWDKCHLFADAGIKVIRMFGPSNDEKAQRISRAMNELFCRGKRRVAIYGAGEHTRNTVAAIDRLGASVVCVIDDDPHLAGMQIGTWSIKPRSELASLKLDAIVISSSNFEEKMWDQTAECREQGIEVVRLYQLGSPKAAIAQESKTRALSITP